jgi:hypothetical protein
VVFCLCLFLNKFFFIPNLDAIRMTKRWHASWRKMTVAGLGWSLCAHGLVDLAADEIQKFTMVTVLELVWVSRSFVAGGSQNRKH